LLKVEGFTMPSDIDYLSAMVSPLRTAVYDNAVMQRPSIPYAGVAIGDATDSSLLSAVRPDRTGTSDLFGDALQPHLGAAYDNAA
jgi:hypothetical protein